MTHIILTLLLSVFFDNVQSMHPKCPSTCNDVFINFIAQNFTSTNVIEQECGLNNNGPTGFIHVVFEKLATPGFPSTISTFDAGQGNGLYTCHKSVFGKNAPPIPEYGSDIRFCTIDFRRIIEDLTGYRCTWG